MRILHFADAHLGADDSGPIVPETGLSTRLTDFLDRLDEIVDYAKREQVDAILFCGDGHHSSRPSPTFVREFAARVRRLGEIAPTVLIVGNHDLPGPVGKAHAVEIYDTLEVNNVHVISRPELLHLATSAGLLQVIGIPFPTIHNLMTSDKVKGLPKGEILRLMQDVVTETIQRLARQLDPNWPSVLAAHLSIQGGDLGGGTPVGLGLDPGIPLEAVALPQFDYVALGHLHRYQQLYDNPPVVYSGSIERLDFGEEKEEKGFVVVEFGKNAELGLGGPGAFTDVEFVPLPARRFQTIQVNLDGSNGTAAVMSAIEEVGSIDGAIVRVILAGTAQAMATVDEVVIQRALAPALRANVIKQVQRDTRVRLEGRSYQEMAPLDLLGAYLESNGHEPARREALMKAAEVLMGEVACA